METKFKLGEKVWMMINNQPTRVEIQQIILSEHMFGGTSVTYKTWTHSGPLHHWMINIEKPFRTKEELLASL